MNVSFLLSRPVPPSCGGQKPIHEVLRRGRESGTPPKVTDVYPKITDIYRAGVLGLVGRRSHTFVILLCSAVLPVLASWHLYRPTVHPYMGEVAAKITRGARGACPAVGVSAPLTWVVMWLWALI